MFFTQTLTSGKRFIASLLFASLTFSSCTSTPGKNSAQVSSSSSELTAGEAIHEQIINDFQSYPDLKLNNYVQEILSKLAQNAKRKNLNYRATILQNERIYATSAPGGEIYITTAFLVFRTGLNRGARN